MQALIQCSMTGCVLCARKVCSSIHYVNDQESQVQSRAGL